VVIVPRPPRQRRGGAQALLRPIADRDRPRVGQHRRPYARRSAASRRQPSAGARTRGHVRPWSEAWGRPV